MQFLPGIGVLLVMMVLCSLVKADESNAPAASSLELQLNEGSRIFGQADVQFRAVEISSSSIGKLAIPLDRIHSIQFKSGDDEALLTLQNGDRLKATVQISAIEVATIFGRISIPLSLLRELQVKAGPATNGTMQGLNQEDWESLPFPEDSNWPGDRGVPPVFKNNEVVLQGGQDVRTKALFHAPLTIECEVMLEAGGDADGLFQVRLIGEDEPKNREPRKQMSLGLEYSHANRARILLLPRPPVRGRDLVEIGPSPIQPGKPFRIRIEVRPDNWRVTVDDQTYDVKEAPAPGEKFFIQLYGWEPPNRWHVISFKTY